MRYFKALERFTRAYRGLTEGLPRALMADLYTSNAPAAN